MVFVASYSAMLATFEARWLLHLNIALLSRSWEGCCAFRGTDKKRGVCGYWLSGFMTLLLPPLEIRDTMMCGVLSKTDKNTP